MVMLNFQPFYDSWGEEEWTYAAQRANEDGVIMYFMQASFDLMYEGGSLDEVVHRAYDGGYQLIASKRIAEAPPLYRRPEFLWVALFFVINLAIWVLMVSKTF